jgi:hypothetical protein
MTNKHCKERKIKKRTTKNNKTQKKWTIICIKWQKTHKTMGEKGGKKTPTKQGSRQTIICIIHEMTKTPKEKKKKKKGSCKLPWIVFCITLELFTKCHLFKCHKHVVKSSLCHFWIMIVNLNKNTYITIKQYIYIHIYTKHIIMKFEGRLYG